MAFISVGRTQAMLAGATRGRVERRGKVKMRESLVLADVYAGRLPGLKDKLICHFKLAADMVRTGVREFVYDTDRPAFLKKELVGFDGIGTGRSEFMITRVDW